MVCALLALPCAVLRSPGLYSGGRTLGALGTLTPPPRLRLSGGGWLGESSESAGDGGAEAPIAPASSGDSSEEDSAAAPGCRYNLTSTGLLDPSQYNVTDDVLDLFLRPPPHPATRDGKALCGVGILLSPSRPHRVEFIKPGSPADLSGKIFVGDEVVSMDGKSLTDLSWEQIRDLGLGFEGTALTLQIIPAESLRSNEPPRASGTSGLSGRPSSSSFTIELSRAPGYLPRWALPVDDDPGGDGPAAQAWKNKTRLYLRKLLVGFPLADLGDWVKMRDADTGRTFYFDAATKRLQFETPPLVQARRQLSKMTGAQVRLPP
jgi:hypothetical protein